MTVAHEPDMTPVTRRLNENVTTLLFRMGWHRKDLAAAIGTSGASISRKLNGQNDWTIPEVEQMASALNVEVGQLLGELPDFNVWRARRDSNPRPSDLFVAEVVELAAYRMRAS